MSEFELVSLIYLIGGIIYLIPSIVAFRRGHPNRWLILVLNIVFGGTGIGWLGCLVWACHAAHITKDPHGSHGGESGLNLTVNDPVRITFDPAAQTASSIDDRIGQLERLQRLRDDAVIDQPEFARLAQEVLNPHPTQGSSSSCPSRLQEPCTSEIRLCGRSLPAEVACL